MADFEFKGYDNFVLAEDIESIIATKLDVNRYMTADYSLQGVDGMTKKIHKYTPSGYTENLARGEGNSNYIDAEYVETEYEVMRNQGQYRYYDDDIMTDSTLIETKNRGLAEAMVNNWTYAAFDEFAKSTNTVTVTDWSIADFADIIGQYEAYHESKEGLFFLAPYTLKPLLQKNLGDELKYVQPYATTGTVAMILGVPIYFSHALPDFVVYCATNKAVTAFIKKGVSVESDRDIDTKLNRVVAARYAVIALTDETECVKAGRAQEDELVIDTPTSTDVKVTGTATAGASVKVIINGETAGRTTADDSGDWEVSCEALEVGDEIQVRATLEGYFEQVAEVTVEA